LSCPFLLAPGDRAPHDLGCIDMALALAPQPFPRTSAEDVLARVREIASSLATEEGHTAPLFPNLCLIRASVPTTFQKAATFGVTLGVALQGELRVVLGRRELSVTPAQLLVVTREGEHLSAAMSAPYLGLNLCFGPERVARALVALAEAGGETEREPVPAFMLAPDAGIAGAIERLLASVSDPLDRKLLAPLAIDEILFRLLRSDAAAAVRSGVGSAKSAAPILEAMQFIRQNHAQKLTVARLAKRAAMSPSHFAHRFSAVARVSPMRYVREARLDHARKLLLEAGSRVGEVALEVGFESPAHFTREFKRRFGVAPSRSLAGVVSIRRAPDED
jgi:AraC-like DNA-binding protein